MAKPQEHKPPASVSPSPTPRRKDGNRDFIEQLVVAFILAFLVRGFEAEAFVIPTGSMAPTLMGRHKEVRCPQCGWVYPVNASEESELSAMGRGRLPVTELSTCGNCRCPDATLADRPNFKGDRILVMKFLYDLPFLPGGGGPKRWDVVVFHYPGEPETNYIKRCVGLPGDTLRVSFGDILTRPSNTDRPFTLERRPLDHQQAMQMLVFDDAHRPAAFKDRPEWRRWQPAASWKETEPGRFAADPKAGGWQELRYRNLVPDPHQWESVLKGTRPFTPPRSTLITDFYAYNTAEQVIGSNGSERPDWYQPHWVGDLTLSCRVEAANPGGQIRLELVEAGVVNRCEIDLKAGRASLSRDGRPLGEPAETGITGGTHQLSFANVDNRLTLWVDGRTPFGDGRTYDDPGDKHPLPTAADLAPAAVAASGADVAVTGLVLQRDIYYTQKPGLSDFGAPPWDTWSGGSNFDPADPTRRVVDLFDRLADPGQFDVFGQIGSSDYIIGKDRFMMMGDNSPRSKDGRGWDRRDYLPPGSAGDDPLGGWDPSGRESWEVPQSLLIGKAFFVYWPHGKPFGPDIRLSRDFRVPFRPYVERMRAIR